VSALACFRQADQQPQALFDRGSFGRQASGRHRLRQQLIVDIDVGSHVDDPIIVYASSRIYISLGRYSLS
jgi:hypothetical protein